MDIAGLLMLVLYLLVGGLVLWGVNYFLTQSELPQPVRMIINLLIVIVILIIVLRKLGIV